MSNIHTLCKKIARLSDADIAGVERIAQEQMDYMHPLKLAGAGKTQATGRKNMEILKRLRELRDLMNS